MRRQLKLIPKLATDAEAGADPALDAAAGEVGAVSPQPSRVVGYRYRDRDFALRRLLLAADFVGLFAALLVAFLIAGLRRLPLEEALWLLPVLPAWAFLFRTYGLYRRPIRRFEPSHLDDISTLFHALVIGTLGLWLWFRLMPVVKLNLEEVVIFGVLSLGGIAALRVLSRRFNLRRQGPERVYVVAPDEDVTLLRRKLENHPEYEMALVGSMGGAKDDPPDRSRADQLGDLEALIASGQIDHLIVRLDSRFLTQGAVQDLMHICHREGIRFGCFPGARSLLWPGVEVNHIEAMGILTSNPPVLSRTSRIMKRLLDLVVSAMLLLFLSPLMALIAAAIALDSDGGVMFRQVRVGQGGKRFRMVKFRTMVPDADSRVAELMAHSSDPDWLILDQDPRVTRIGAFLRKASLDELPQLWNVLKGEMSLVGPRPLTECDDDAVKGWGRHRLDLVPGVTGYWQVLGRNSIPFKEMIEIDYAYIAGWSMQHDIKLLFQTIPVVLRRRGAN